MEFPYDRVVDLLRGLLYGGKCPCCGWNGTGKHYKCMVSSCLRVVESYRHEKLATVSFNVPYELRRIIRARAGRRGMTPERWMAKALASFVKRPDLGKMPKRRPGRKPVKEAS